MKKKKLETCTQRVESMSLLVKIAFKLFILLVDIESCKIKKYSGLTNKNIYMYKNTVCIFKVGHTQH